MGTLYLVATPIGNLEDITLRALRVLREASLIAAEDTRYTRRLLNHYDIHTPCISYHEHNKLTRLDALRQALATGDVALVSDAGTPGLSDPGYELVNACIAEGIAVSPIPGPSAPIAALVASGLPTDRALYLGFLPRRSSERRTLFASLLSLPFTLICFEAPHRLLAALADALTVLGERRMVVARELTRLHEEFVRGTISEVQEHFTLHPPRGACTLVIAGVAETGAGGGSDSPSETDIVRRLRLLHAEGHSGSSAARSLAKELGMHKSEVYQLWLTMMSDDEKHV